jgi:hypothetical protein
VLVPEPALTGDVFDPYDVDVPYSTYHVVETPPGLTEPVTVAVVAPVAVVGPVEAVGAAASADPVKTIEAARAVIAVTHRVTRRAFPEFVSDLR